MAARPVRSIVCLLVVFVALGAGSGSAALADDPTSGAAGGPGASPAIVDLQAAPEADTTVTRIVVHENGSATWTLQVRTRLETDENASEYRAFQERFRENTSRYLDDFRAGITGIVANAREVTGREMAATAFRAETSIQTVPRRWGVVTFEFRWDGFAAADGGRLVVGDVFEGGLFIAEGDTLEVVAPEDYRIDSAEPTPDESEDGVVTWTGREDFADRRPRVAMIPSGGTGLGSLPWWAVGAGAAALGLALVALLGYRRYGGSGSETADGSVGAGGSGVADEPDDQALLADEDHVLRLLEDRGGRARQQAIADELDWSRSKTSRVLGRMAEADQIRKLQLGRENVIALPEETDEPGE